jgi:site-specific recombinase XerD
MMMKANKESILLAQRIHTFLSDYVPSQKSQSEHTLKSYEYAISLYIGFLETEKGIRPEKLCGDNFNQYMIEEWLKWLVDKRGCSPGTCNNRLSSLRGFLKYLGERDISMLYLYEAATTIQRRKEPYRKIQGMSKRAVQALMAVPDVSTTAGQRDLTLIVTMYNTAARLDEILSMKVGQLHLDARKPYVTVIGKGDKIRTLYLLPKAVAHIRKYLREQHGTAPDENAYVFYSRNTGSHGKLSQTAVNKRLKLHAIEAHKLCAEIPETLHAHQLRHAKASHWLEDGMNIVQISFLLGHEQVETTMVYLDVTTGQERRALATLEDENDRNVSKKWKTGKGSLASFCGIRGIAQ